MTKHDNFMVAVELGSSKVNAVAGMKQPDGAVEIFAAAQEPSNTFIRKGRIYNVDKFDECLGRLKEKLEKGVGMSIAKAYVGIGGMGMHSVLNTITKNYPNSVKVTLEMIDVIQEENSTSKPVDRDIVDVVPQEYKVSQMKTVEPVGMLTQSITGNFLNIVSAANSKQQIIEHFHRCGIDVVDLPITFLALAESILSDKQRQSGCVFVDMGAQTTSIAIYKSGLLRHLAVIPLGGANITEDIVNSFQIDDAEAEELKLNYNFAMEEIDADDKEQFTTSDGRVFAVNDLKKLVSARLEEIIINVKYQVELSQFTLPQLVSGFFLTGGVTQTRGIENAFRTVIGSQISVRVTNKIKQGVRTSLKEFNKDGSYDSVVSLLDKGNENCCGGPIGEGGGLFPQKPAQPKPEAAPEVKPAENTDATNHDGKIKVQVPGEETAAVAETAEQDKTEAAADKKERTSTMKKGFGKFFNKAKDFLTKLTSEDEN